MVVLEPAEAPVVGEYEQALEVAAPRPPAPTAAMPMTAPVPTSVSSVVPERLPVGDPPLDGAEGQANADLAPRQSTCTTAQLRRFIKSRAYLPMHELRRRFAIEGTEDDVTGVDLRGTWVFVGLPDREGSMLGELLRGGEVGFELSHDPVTPVVVGVFPMRPIPRS